jgi:prolipoprotein diacylglyceryl transferase
MFPRISDIVNNIFGLQWNIPIQTYGFMLAISFATGAWIPYLELKRREKEGLIPVQHKKAIKARPAMVSELIFTAIFGFILGWKGFGIVMDYSLFNKDPQDYILSGEGSWIAGLLCAIFFAGLQYLYGKRKVTKPPAETSVTIHAYQLTWNILLIAAITGILGSKIFDILDHPADLIQDPAGTLFSFTGLSFYGGLIIATLAVIWYARRNKIPLLQLLDATAPALILAYAIGRSGCQLSGDGCWGIPNLNPKPEWLSLFPDWVWSFRFPHNVIDDGVLMPQCKADHCYILPQPVWPTSLYESILCLFIFIILWCIRRHLTVPGYLFSIYIIMNGIERFLIEQIRINKVYWIFGMGLSQAQIIAIILILLGLLGLLLFRWLKKK